MHKVYVIDLGRKFLYLQWIDAGSGKRKTKSAKTAKRREAERKAKDLEDQLNQYFAPADGSIGWKQFVDRYQHQHLSSLAAASEKKSLGVLETFGEISGVDKLISITPSMLSWYAGQLRSRGRTESTIAGHIRTIRAALSWASDAGLLNRIPAVPKIARSKSHKSRGRPLTLKECGKMLRATRAVVDQRACRSWRTFLRGLWYSGLRLAEAMELRWTPGLWPWIDHSGQTWWLVIPPEAEKGFTERRLPVVPDWKRQLERTPQELRIGHVFMPLGDRGARVSIDRVSHVISDIGEEAGIVVDGTTGRTATAHDFRRAFAQRWSTKLAPVDLQRLMRHADIKTTLQYYLDADSDGLAKRIGADNT